MVNRGWERLVQPVPGACSRVIRPQLAQRPGRLDGSRRGEPHWRHDIARGQKTVLLLLEQLQLQLIAFGLVLQLLSFESCLLTSLLCLPPGLLRNRNRNRLLGLFHTWLLGPSHYNTHSTTNSTLKSRCCSSTI